jgi:hypothetical protein
MTSATSYLKQYCGKPFLETFRSVLYDHRIHWGAKCFVFALLDLSLNLKRPEKVIARKFGVPLSEVYRWRSELEKRGGIHFGMFLRPRLKK